MRFSSLAVAALSTLLIGSVEAVFTGQATFFTGIVPVESGACDGVFYTQGDYVVKLSSQNTTPCNATIAVAIPEYGRSIYGVRVVDNCVGCGEDDVVLSALTFADLAGYIPLPSETLSVEWYVDSVP